jgi:putative heme-binding domain-containing protein
VANALVALEPDSTLSALVPLVADPAVSEELRRRISEAVVERDPARTSEALVEAVRATPRRLQIQLAAALAGSAEGAGALLKLVEEGVAAPQLLARRSIREKILAARPGDGAERIESLTAQLPEDSEARRRLIAGRLQTFVFSEHDPARGASIFEEQCSICHQIGDKGAQIGPQLDGIGSRGPERILEDVLDPHRVVDVAYRSTTFVLDDGRVITGLYRRDEGEMVIVADSEGNENSLPGGRILQRVKSENSHMPDNFADVIPLPDFNHLVGYLLSETTTKVEASVVTPSQSTGAAVLQLPSGN